MKLYKTTIVIWSDIDPINKEIDDLARDAVCGDNYCSKRETKVVLRPENDQDWDGTEFFGIYQDNLRVA